jgi:putative ATP-binding cassette transporter
VFSDFYLLDKLYGIDHAARKDAIEYYSEVLQISEKINFIDGNVEASHLSTGQKKRVALLIALLEDRPVIVLDEWAADQDPEFRAYFYEHLLPMMKLKNKCVIAITHDDRYFDCADRVIKMESGKIINEYANEAKYIYKEVSQ